MGPGGSWRARSRYASTGRHPYGQQTGSRFARSFSEIEKILGRPLPASANRPQWWANATQIGALLFTASLSTAVNAVKGLIREEMVVVFLGGSDGMSET
jgi:hypothetical protein